MAEVTFDNMTNFLNDSAVANETSGQALVLDELTLDVRNLIYNYLGPIVCGFGMTTNIINLIVLTQNQLPESPYTHLTGLACVDFGALMLSFIFMVFSKDSFSYEWKFFDAYIFIGIVNICTTSSVWITVLLTIERFLFVRHPLWAKDTCDHASAKLKVLITIGAASIFNIPRFLAFKPHNLEQGVYILGQTKFRTSDVFLIANWVYSALIHFVPLLVLSAANIYLVYAVHEAGSMRQRLQIRNNREAAWQREQRRLTITLISIVFLFIICIIPSAFSDLPIAYALFGGDKTLKEFRSSSFYLILQYVSNFLVWLELSLNFVLYLAFNEKFRRVMKFTATRFFKKFARTRESNSMKVHFKSGHSSTRNSVLNTNSLSMNSKGSMGQQESQPLKKLTDNGNPQYWSTEANGETPLVRQAESEKN